LINRYVSKKNFLKNATSPKELKKFKKVVDLFRRYSGEYDLNYLLMMAMGYQESRLDQSVKSHVGAIGIMQLMPETGKAMKVGNIKEVEPNIHAGIKYHHTLTNQYFNDPSLDEINRTLFTFAAYNAGPARIKKMRQEAEKRGLNPNKWFNNVELVVAEKIGDETINYVTSIFKYYISYKLFEEKKEEKQKVKKTLSNSMGIEEM
jgi:membrane-bound lytic murein transglycosylase MltF